MRENAWFPGHMAKARDAISRTRSAADFFLVVLDARIPRISRNFDLSGLAPLHKCIFCLNRSDLACESATNDWLRWFSSQGQAAESTNTVTGQGLSGLRHLLASQKEQVIEKRSAKGRKDRTLFLIVVGMPNVGKSSILNRLGGVGSAATGRKPGITRGPQWIRLKQGFSILDTPGILTPGRLAPDDVWKLHACGILPDEKVDSVETASRLLALVHPSTSSPASPKNILPSPSPSHRPSPSPSHKGRGNQGIVHMGRGNQGKIYMESLEELGRTLGFLKRGGIVDIERTAQHYLKEFQTGRLGRWTLEEPGT